MDALMEKWLGGATYVEQARQQENAHDARVKHLLQHGKLPQEGWSDIAIESLLLHLSRMDSNNFDGIKNNLRFDG
jgi:hypothetical protein